MIPTVATSLTSREMVMAWKQRISQDWNMISYDSAVGVGVRLDQRVLGRRHNRSKPQHDLTSEPMIVAQKYRGRPRSSNL